MNCSASGKRKGGDCHVRMALGQRGFTVLLRPLFFLNLFKSFSINLLNCKHRTGFASGGVTCKHGAFCFYSSLVLVDSFVLRNPPERKARNRYDQFEED